METYILVILGAILFLLLALNHITIIETTVKPVPQGTCSQTTFGCCPDGVNSKVNYYGTNCPGFKPAPYPPPPPPPTPTPRPPPPAPGGCISTRYGCCSNGTTAKIDANGSNCMIGGCAGTRYGCCLDNITPKQDYYGTNCKSYAPSEQSEPVPVEACISSTFGCCPNGKTPRLDNHGINCVLYKPPIPNLPGCAGSRYGCCPDGVTAQLDGYGLNCKGGGTPGLP
jgi:hypothetical protein